MADVIAVANTKGGAGKTTTSLHLAAGLTKIGKRVLLIDADMVTRGASKWMGIREGQGSLSFQLLAMSEAILHTQMPELLARSDYDTVIIDCPPGGPKEGGAMTRSALMACDLVIIPVSPSGLDFWASTEMAPLMELTRVYKPNIKSQVLINRKITGTRTGKFARDGAGMFDMPIFEVEISSRTAIAEAITRGLTVYEFQPSNPSVLEYDKLVQEVTQCLAPATLSASPHQQLIS